MPKRALFIGRFQPLHLGHLDALQQIFDHPDGYEEIIIAVCSAEKSYLPGDPLMASERQEIILLALQEVGIPKEKVHLVPIRNIDHYALWPYYVRELCPEFQGVFSGSPLVRMLWQEAFPNGQYEIHAIEKRTNISASEIREKLRAGIEVSAGLTPNTSEYLQKIGLAERLKQMKTT